MAIKKVGLSWIAISDFEKSKDFFVNTLGLKIAEEQKEYSWIELKGSTGGSILGACKGEKNFPAGSNAVVTFVTDTYDQTKKELEGKGIKFFDEIAGYPGVPRMISFKDMDGNNFQLVEETPGETDK